MSWTTGVRLGVRGLVRHPIRSLLVVQGIAWAVALPVFLGAILEGTTTTALERAAEVGTGRLNVAADRAVDGRGLRAADAASLGESLSARGVDVTATGAVRRMGAAQFTADGVHAQGTLLMAHGDDASARGQSYAAGRAPASAGEVSLEPALAAALGITAPGARVRTDDGSQLTVVGLLAPRSETALGTDDMGLMREGPFAEMVKVLMVSLGGPSLDDGWKRDERCARVAPGAGDGAAAEVDWVFVRVAPQDAPRAADLASAHLSEQGVAPLVLTNLLWPALADGTMDRFEVLFGALVACCLALGVLVVSCLMLYSVARRTAEFGVRRAEGATAADVAVMVLVEAAVLGVVAGLFGVPLGVLLAKIRVGFGPYSVMAVAFPPAVAAWSVALGIAAGVLSGIAPAWRAARMQPADALRRPS